MASIELRIADDLALPLDAVTETILLIAMRGSGKTHTATVLVEEMITAGLPVCVIDPTGVWWGLRSSADGTGPGLPVTILGGLHADLPLDHTSGAVIAEFLVAEQIPLLLDLSEMSKTQMRRFATDFLERLYHLKNQHREPLHLVVDEADLLAPMSAGKDMARLLGAYDDIARRGRARGLGLTSITQRPAKLHTDVRSQAQMLMALRLTGTHDIAAIDVWVSAHATAEDARELKASLPSMPVGTAWVWSPGWLQILQKVHIRQRRTFDSSATPKVGQVLTAPRSFATVDLDALAARMADTIEKAAQDDPAALRRQIADLQAQLRRARPAHTDAEVADLRRQLAEALARPAEQVEVPVLAPGVVAELEQAIADVRDIAGGVELALGRATAAPRPVPPPVPAPRPAVAAPRPLPPEAPAAQPDDDDTGGGDAALKKGARTMLAHLARQHPMKLTRAQLATMSRIKSSGSTFSAYLSNLRTAGYIAEDGRLIGLTPSGLEVAGIDADAAPMTSEEIIGQWRTVLKRGARVMLDYLVDRYPEAATREDLSEAVGIPASGSTFSAYLSNLRTNGLAEVQGSNVRASDDLFPVSAALEGSGR